MNVVFYAIGVVFVLLGLQVIAFSWMGDEGTRSALLALAPMAVGAYFLFLGRRCTSDEGEDVTPYIKQGGYVLMGLGAALAALSGWAALPYFTGESCSAALLGLFVGAPIVLVLWAVGITALVAARR